MASCAGTPTPPQTPPAVSVIVRTDGRLDITTSGITFAATEVIARWEDGTERALSSMTLSQRTPTTVVGTDSSGLSVSLQVAPVMGQPGSSELTWQLNGTGRLRGIELRAPETSLPDNTRMVIDGAQSWSFTGALTLVPGQLLPRDAMGRVTYPDGMGDVLADVPGRSTLRSDLVWGTAGLSVCATAPYDRWLLVSVERPTTGYALRITDGVYPDETLDLARGGTLSGHVVFSPADPTTPFACTTAARPPASTRGARPFPHGYWTWNTLFASVTAMDAMAGFAAARSTDLRVTHLTLDDGWESAWGNWTPRPDFGATIPSLVSSVATVQGSIGLWLAPFLVYPAAPIYTQQPDWLVHDATGAVLQVPFVLGKNYAILDATHPDALTYLTGVFSELRAQGVRLFKIDYLFAAAWPGVRHDSTATGLVAYRQGLTAIATGAGDAHLNGCGAFILPSLAFVDSLRVGADDAYATVPPFWGAVAAAARNFAVRRSLWNLGVTPDPDQLVVHGLTPDEGRASLALSALSGPAMGYGDDLSRLTTLERSLYSEAWFTLLRDNAVAPAVAVDLSSAVGSRFLLNPLVDLLSGPTISAAPPSVFVQDLTHGQRAVVVFNWSNTPAVHTVARSLFADVPAPTERVHGDPVVPSGDAYALPVPAHGVRVLVGSVPSPRSL